MLVATTRLVPATTAIVVVGFGLLLLSAKVVQAQDLAESQRTFADNLIPLLYDNKDNECSSALGISMAFSLVYPSMIGTSQEQVQSVFGFPKDHQDGLVWDETATQLSDTYTGECLDNPEFCELVDAAVLVSNSIWVNDNSELEIGYTETVANYLQQADFQDAASATLINNWVSEATKGLIDSIIDAETLRTASIVAINAIYLKASWASQFETFRTNQDVFYSSVAKTEASKSDALFMHQVEEFPYSHEALEGYQVLQLPLRGGPNNSGLSMILVLPTTNAGSLASSEDVVTTALPKLVTQRVAVALPKFELEVTYQQSLMKALMELGIVAPFAGNLCIFENNCETRIDLVVQKTFISLDEEGVEAAAVTALVGVTSFPIYENEPTEFMADHPFQFFIYEKSTDLVLFEGLIGNPEPQADATAASLNAKHVEDGFWTDHFNVNPTVVETSIMVVEPTTTTEAPTLAPQVTTPAPQGTTITTDAPTDAPTVVESSSNKWMVGSTLAAGWLLTAGLTVLLSV